MDYFLYLDRAGNINHWISEFEFESTSGVEFVKSASDSLGKYSRIGPNNSFFLCSPFEAAARLVATGGGILYLIGSLFDSEFLEKSAGDGSFFQSADTSVRLADTTIYDESCYVIENSRTHLYTQKMADQQQQRIDSIHNGITLPEGLTLPKFKQVLGPKTLKAKYFIRSKDFMIVRREEFQLDSTAITSKSILFMDPMHDIKNFEKYLKQ